MTRVILAVVLFLAVNASLLGVTLGVPGLGQLMERMQILPAITAFSMASLVLWVVLTLLLGRVYCSVFCPLGVFQDIVARVPRLTRRQRYRRPYRYAQAKSQIRNLILIATGASLVVVIPQFTSFIDPYMIYSRFVTDWSPRDRVMAAGVVATVVDAACLIAVGIFAWRRGRLYCNSVCPVGTLLGALGRYSVMKIDINTDKCTQCRACEYACKSQCINLSDHTVDSTRCVVCFDCLPVCDNSAITYTKNRHQLALPMLQRVGTPGRAATAMSAPSAGRVTPARRATREISKVNLTR